MSMSRRPLTSSDADAELFVDRDDQIRHIERTVALEGNVLIVGPPGAGKTSLVRRLQGRSRDAAQEWVYVDGSPWQQLEHALAAIGAALGRDVRNQPRLVDPGDWQLEKSMVAVRAPHIVTELDVDAALAVGRGEERSGPPRTIAVDGLAPELAFDLFGRFRDRLWEHRHRWVVTVSEAHRGDLLRPPAAAFFEAVVDLDELAPRHVEAMLLLRAQGLPPADERRLRAIAGVLGDGRPRQPGPAIALAREAMSSELPVRQVFASIDEAEVQAAELGGTAAVVYRALQELGEVHAGDDRLLRRVGLSRGRVVQVLQELVDAAVVDRRRQGRRVLYFPSYRP